MSKKEMRRMMEKVKQASFQHNSVKDDTETPFLFHGEDKQQKLAILKNALENHSFVVGVETERSLVGGRAKVSADFAHLDFMLAGEFGKSIQGYPVEHMNSNEFLSVFWHFLWPYLDKMFKAHDDLALYLTRIIKDNEELLEDSAEVIEDYKIMEEWIRKQGVSFSHKFNNYRRERKEALRGADVGEGSDNLHVGDAVDDSVQ